MWLKTISAALVALSASTVMAQQNSAARRAPERVTTTISAACGKNKVVLQYQNGYHGNPSKFLSLSVDGKIVPGATGVIHSVARSREIASAEVMYCIKNRKYLDADIVINFSPTESDLSRLPKLSVFHLRTNKLTLEVPR